MKKILSICLAFLILLGCTSAFAEEMILITQKPITVTYNGDAINFPDALPLIQNGRTLVPARAIMERAKLSVAFDNATRTVTATRDDLTITMTIDETAATVTSGGKSQSIMLEEPARIIADRTYVPIRFISESMNLKVNWNANYREVVLIDTAEWRQEIAENAKLLHHLLSTPVASYDAFTTNFSGNVDLSLIFKNLPTETNGSAGLTTRFALTITGSEMYDGTSGAAYTLCEADLSALQTLAKYFSIDSTELGTWAKKHKIDLDVVVDKDWNLYIKSNGLLELLKLSNKALADAIGNKYVIVPISALLGAEISDAGTCKTAFELIEKAILQDDMLYTQSAQILDETVSLYTQMFHNDAIKISERYDGTELWSLTLNQDNAKDLLFEAKRLREETAGTPLTEAELAEQKAVFDAMRFKITVSLSLKNGAPVKTELIYTVDSGETKLQDFEATGKKTPTLRTVYKINVGTSTKKSTIHSQQKINLPKNVITLDELEKLVLTE